MLRDKSSMLVGFCFCFIFYVDSFIIFKMLLLVLIGKKYLGKAKTYKLI